MAMTLTILSLSLCGGLLSESAPSARLLAQNDEVQVAPPLPGPSSREELLASMPGLGGPIGLIVGGAVLTFASLYVLPYLVTGVPGLIALVIGTAVGAVLTGVGIGTLIGNIVRRARIQRQIRRLERRDGYEYGFHEAQQPQVAMLTFQLP